MKFLEIGYYWVRYNEGEPIIMEYDGCSWSKCGYTTREGCLIEGDEIVGKVNHAPEIPYINPEGCTIAFGKEIKKVTEIKYTSYNDSYTIKCE